MKRLMMAVALLACAVPAYAQESSTAPAPSAPAAAAPDAAGKKAPLSDAQLLELLKRILGPPEFKGREGVEIVTKSGPVVSKDRIVSAPLDYVAKGVIKGDANFKAMFIKATWLKDGQPVFRIRLGSLGEAWCGTRNPEKQKKGSMGECLVGKNANGQYTRSSSIGLSSDSLYYPRYYGLPTNLVEPFPTVEERADAEFGIDLQVHWAFEEWDPTEAEVYQYVTDGLGGQTFLAVRRLPIAADGSATLKAYGGEFKLTPGKDRKSANVEILKPPAVRDVSATLGDILAPSAAPAAPPPAEKDAKPAQ